MSNPVTLGFTSTQELKLPLQKTRTLNRREAESKLHELTPGTEEYTQLQNALIKTTGIVEIRLREASYKVNTHSGDCILHGGFGSSEHVAIGKAIKLDGLPNGKDTPLLIRGVTPVFFHHIVALAGDFYGIAGQAISLPGGTDQEKTERFIKAFNTLAEADNNELRKLLFEVEDECTAVEHSSLPHHCYSSQMMERSNAISKIKSDFEELLFDNSDHFSTNAQDAYRIGHAEAMKVAREADKLTDKEKKIEGLKRAYAMDAFACHFLTDLFAAGHIRNQRGDLEIFLIKLILDLKIKLEHPEKIAKMLAGLLTAAQHEKDGNEGLNVANQQGDYWRAYGDGCFFSPKNAGNKEKAIAATQQSVNEVYKAFLGSDNNNVVIPEPSAMDKLIPFVTSMNPPPIYSVKGNGKSLFLNRGSEQVEITTMGEFLSKGISEALRHLPDDYVSSFIDSFIGKIKKTIKEQLKLDMDLDLTIVRKASTQIGRLTGSIYYQVKQDNQKLNKKVDEMADIMSATLENTDKVLKEIEEMQSKLDQLTWSDRFKELQIPITEIRTVTSEHECYGSIKDESAKKLWSAHNNIASILKYGTTSGIKILPAYASTFKDSKTPMSEEEIKIASTVWFRQMIDYQVHAFRHYTNFKMKKNAQYNDKIQKKALKFESRVQGQIEANKEYIDEKLLYKSQSYINNKIAKIKTINAFNNLIIPK